MLLEVNMTKIVFMKGNIKRGILLWNLFSIIILLLFPLFHLPFKSENGEIGIKSKVENDYHDQIVIHKEFLSIRKMEMEIIFIIIFCTNDKYCLYSEKEGKPSNIDMNHDNKENIGNDEMKRKVFSFAQLKELVGVSMITLIIEN